MIAPWQRSRFLPGALVVCCYIVFSAAWILLGDAFVGRIATDGEQLRTWQTLKGLAFVGLSALVIGWFVAQHRVFQRTNDEQKELLEQSEDSYRSMFRGSISVMLLMDAESGEIVDANPAALRFYGYRREELVGRHISVINTLDEEALERELALARSQRKSHFEFRHRLADGTVREVRSHTGPIRRGGRELLYSIVQDVTDQLATETTLRLHSAALAAAANGIVITDTDGKIQWANEAFTQMTGYALKEVVGKDPAILNSGMQADDFYQDLWRTVQGGSQWHGELVNRRKDGTTYTEKQSITPVRDAAGTVSHYIAVKQDVTDAKRAQSEIARRALQQQVISELGQQALRGADLEELVQSTVTSVANVLDVELVNLLDLRPDGASFRLRAAVGWPHGTNSETEIPNHPDSQAGYTLRCSKPVVVKELARETRFRPSPLLLAAGVVSGVGVVIDNGEVPYGILSAHTRYCKAFSDNDVAFLQGIANTLAAATRQRRYEREIQESNQQLLHTYDATIEGWAKALELRDHETEGHSRRVTRLSVELAEHMGLDEAELRSLRRGALLHDIGKMGVPDSILLKPGKLSEGEWKVMRNHTTFARDLLSRIPFLEGAVEVPYSHHEKWDGSGYPRGLAAKDIPLAARIFAVVDVFDALTSDRPYRAAWSRAEALAHLGEQAGHHFDPDVVLAFQQLLEKEGSSPSPGGAGQLPQPQQSPGVD